MARDTGSTGLADCGQYRGAVRKEGNESTELRQEHTGGDWIEEGTHGNARGDGMNAYGGIILSLDRHGTKFPKHWLRQLSKQLESLPSSEFPGPDVVPTTPLNGRVFRIQDCKQLPIFMTSDPPNTMALDLHVMQAFCITRGNENLRRIPASQLLGWVAQLWRSSYGYQYLSSLFECCEYVKRYFYLLSYATRGHDYYYAPMATVGIEGGAKLGLAPDGCRPD